MHVIKVYSLKNQNEAKYMSISSFKVLIFEKNNWQYMFSVGDRVSDIVTPEILVQIADSIDYSVE